jgi:hypothetical protein
VRHAPEPTEQRQAREVCVVDAAHLENTVWANLDAIFLTLTAAVIDDRSVLRCGGLALLTRSIGMLRRAARFLVVQIGICQSSFLEE